MIARVNSLYRPRRETQPHRTKPSTKHSFGAIHISDLLKVYLRDLNQRQNTSSIIYIIKYNMLNMFRMPSTPSHSINLNYVPKSKHSFELPEPQNFHPQSIQQIKSVLKLNILTSISFALINWFRLKSESHISGNQWRFRNRLDPFADVNGTGMFYQIFKAIQLTEAAQPCTYACLPHYNYVYIYGMPKINQRYSSDKPSPRWAFSLNHSRELMKLIKQSTF